MDTEVVPLSLFAAKEHNVFQMLSPYSISFFYLVGCERGCSLDGLIQGKATKSSCALFWHFDQGKTRTMDNYYTYCMPEVHTLFTPLVNRSHLQEPERSVLKLEMFAFSFLLRKTFGFYTVKWLVLADRRPLDLLSSNEEMQSISSVVYGEAFPCLALLISISLVEVEV